MALVNLFQIVPCPTTLTTLCLLELMSASVAVLPHARQDASDTTLIPPKLQIQPRPPLQAANNYVNTPLVCGLMGLNTESHDWINVPPLPSVVLAMDASLYGWVAHIGVDQVGDLWPTCITYL